MRFSYVDKLYWLQGNVNLLARQNVVIHKEPAVKSWCTGTHFSSLATCTWGTVRGILHAHNDPFSITKFPAQSGKKLVFLCLLNRMKSFQIILNFHIHQSYQKRLCDGRIMRPGQVTWLGMLDGTLEELKKI